MEDADTFREEDQRLDNLLDKMIQPDEMVGASNIISVFLSEEGGNGASRILNDSNALSP